MQPPANFLFFSVSIADSILSLDPTTKLQYCAFGQIPVRRLLDGVYFKAVLLTFDFFFAVIAPVVKQDLASNKAELLYLFSGDK